jgi:predicted transcriptional regulator
MRREPAITRTDLATFGRKLLREVEDRLGRRFDSLEGRFDNAEKVQTRMAIKLTDIDMRTREMPAALAKIQRDISSLTGQVEASLAKHHDVRGSLTVWKSITNDRHNDHERRLLLLESKRPSA